MNRLKRRYLRDKKITQRMLQWKQYYTDNKYHITPGILAKKSSLGCPDGKKCRICHPTSRIPTKQEIDSELEIQEHEEDNWSL